jgi:cell division protein FtsL
VPRPLQYALLAGVVLACVGVAVLLKQTRTVLTKQEQIMAQFEGLDADINEMKTSVAAAARRVEAAVDRLTDDKADQAEIDQARVEVREAIDQLKAIAPEPAEEPTPEPTPEPAPTEPTA